MWRLCCDCWSWTQESWFSATSASRFVDGRCQKSCRNRKAGPQPSSLTVPSAHAERAFPSFLLYSSSLKSAGADICVQVIRLCWHCLISPPLSVLPTLISHHKVSGRNLEIPHLRILLLPLYSLFVASVAAAVIVFIPCSSSSSDDGSHCVL